MDLSNRKLNIVYAQYLDTHFPWIRLERERVMSKIQDQSIKLSYQQTIHQKSMQALHSQADSLVRMGEQSLQALHHHEDGNKSKQTLKHDRK